MISDITGVILAGGKSSRMGRNKALLVMPGSTRPILDVVIERMSSLFSRVLLSVHQADAFPECPLTQVVDRYPETGPMGGITSVLESGEHRIFCVACDMPFLNPALIEALCALADCDAVVPVWRGKLETLHAFYSSNLLPHFQELLKQNRFRIADSFAEAHVRFVQEPEIKRLDPTGASFRNINTPLDYESLDPFK